MLRWLIFAALIQSAGCHASPATSPQPRNEAPPAVAGAPEARPDVVRTEPPLESVDTGQPSGSAQGENVVEDSGTGAKPAPLEAPPVSGPDPAKVRPAALAGTWYEADAETLRKQVQDYLSAVPQSDFAGYPVALLAPHAGHRYSGALAARSYALLQGRTYGRVFVLGPAHRTALKGVALPAGVTHFETPLGQIPLAMDVLQELRERPLFVEHPSAHRQEHSIEIHLPFLQVVLPRGFELVPLVVAGLNRAEIEATAAVLREVIRPGDLLIASSDFTHYGERFSYLGPPGKEFGPAAASQKLQALLDSAWQAIAARDAEAFLRHKVETRDTICGYLPIALLLKVVTPEAVPQLLGTGMSGEKTGSYAESVSYLAAAFAGLWPYLGVAGEGALTVGEKDALLTLARRQVNAFVNGQERLTPEALGGALTPRLQANSGTFVTLKQQGRLRGCIGNIMPVKPLVQGVLDNAVNAASFDRRFKPVRPDELSGITVEVSVLTTPVERDDWRDLVLGRDGIIVSKPGGSAVFLPQVAVEQGWTLEETLEHLSSKAGLGRDGWRDGATFQAFEAIVFHEEP